MAKECIPDDVKGDSFPRNCRNVPKSVNALQMLHIPLNVVPVIVAPQVQLDEVYSPNLLGVTPRNEAAQQPGHANAMPIGWPATPAQLDSEEPGTMDHLQPR